MKLKSLIEELQYSLSEGSRSIQRMGRIGRKTPDQPSTPSRKEKEDASFSRADRRHDLGGKLHWDAKVQTSKSSFTKPTRQPVKDDKKYINFLGNAKLRTDDPPLKKRVKDTRGLKKTNKSASAGRWNPDSLRNKNS